MFKINKKWIEEDCRYILYFTPYYDEIELAELYCDEIGDWWCYILGKDEEYINANTVTEAKEFVEDIIEEYYSGEMSYYKELLERFKE